MFVIDDAAVIAAEAAQAAEAVEAGASAVESAEVVGDGVGEFAANSNIESVQLNGDSIHEPFFDTKSVLGDGTGECTSNTPDLEIYKDYSNDSGVTNSEFVESNVSEVSTDVSNPELNDGNVTNQSVEENTESSEPAPRRIKTTNENLEGEKHPETGVPFERKVVETDTGEKVEGVFPQFESKFDAQLPEGMETESDRKQFDECNKQLKDKCDSDPEFAKQFDEEQLEQIKNGDTPDGYTWHHNEEKGKLQLVESEIHAKTGHTGGRSVWGGGTDNR